MPAKPRNGFIEVRFNIDQSQAFANIYPPEEKGEPITLEECLSQLRAMGASYGFRESALSDAIAKASATNAPVMDVIAAQGELVHNGEDAQIRYIIPRELVIKPLPKREDGTGWVDWFALDPRKMVKEGVEVAAVIPATLGAHGKTITWPIQLVHAQPGRTATLFAGGGVRASQDGSRLFAIHDGYLYQQAEQMIVVGMNLYEESVKSEDITLNVGAIFLAGITFTHLRTEGTIAVKGKCQNSQLRSLKDIYVEDAEDCQIIAAGNVYVTGSLKNCTVVTPHLFATTKGVTLVGGRICATEGLDIWSLGSEVGENTEVVVGQDMFLALRTEEIEKEIAEAEANKERIRQAIKPFQTVSANANMTEDRRAIMLKLQAQLRSQEQRINELHSERRQMHFSSKQKTQVTVSVQETLHAGVLLTFGKQQSYISSPMTAVRLKGNSESGEYRTEMLEAA